MNMDVLSFESAVCNNLVLYAYERFSLPTLTFSNYLQQCVPFVIRALGNSV
jgi:hypothetical protein